LEIEDLLWPGKRCFGIDDPFLLSQGIEIAPEDIALTQLLQSREELKFATVEGLSQQFQESPAEEARQHPYGQKEPRPTGHPAPPIGGESAAGHHAVQMRVVDQILSPGVQDREEADLGAQVLRVCADGAQCVSRGGEQQIINHRLVLVRNGRDLLGQREDDVEVLAVQELRLATLDPLCPSERLALWAVPIATAVVRDALMLTGIARLNVSAERSGAARGDRPHDAPLRIRQRRLVLRTISCTVAAEDIRHFEPGSLHGEPGLEVLGRFGRFRRRQRKRQQIQRTAGRADLGGCQT